MEVARQDWGAEARAAEAGADWNAAAALWFKAENAQPSAEAAARRVACLGAAARYGEAYEALASALAGHGPSPELVELKPKITAWAESYHNANAMTAYETGDYTTAIDELEKLLVVAPAHPYAPVYLDRAVGRLPDFGAILRRKDGDRPRRRFFVVGCGRSGTWLALGLMGTYADAAVIYEEVPVGHFARMTAAETNHVLKRQWDSYKYLESYPSEITIVYVLRFPLDVLVSRHIDVERYIKPERWLNEIAALKRLWERTGGTLTVVRYEDMVERPNETQALLAQRTGLQIQRPFSRFYEDFSVQEHVESAMNGLRSPDTRSIGRWRATGENLDYCKSIWPDIAELTEWTCETFGYDQPAPLLR